MASILPTNPRHGMLVALVLPIALLALLVGAVLVLDPASRLESSAPPVEDIAFERVELQPGRMLLHVRNAATTNTIAQVMVDDAYWLFTMEPSTTLGRYEAGVITLEYPWVEGEAHLVVLVTSAGTVFEHEIAVAVETPTPTPANLMTYAWIGILVGVIPIAVGMLFLPAMRRLADAHYNAVLALTLGVLGFLAVDTVTEGLELAGDLPAAFHGTALFFAAALLAVLGVLALSRIVRGRGTAMSVAILIAIAIGLHNLGEGLLIGSAFALGSLTLGSTLIAGFALHNVTEGPAIVSPLAAPTSDERAASRTAPTGRTASDRKLTVGRFLLLAALGGVPTVLGAWLGAFTTTGLLSVVFFGLGAGAIIVVILQVGGAMRQESAPAGTPAGPHDSGGLWTAWNMGAFAVGFLLMVATALLVAG